MLLFIDTDLECLLTHDDVTLSRPDRNDITISMYFHVMSQALSRWSVWGTCSYEKTTYSLNDPFAPCKLHGFPRLTATFFWQLRRRGRVSKEVWPWPTEWQWTLLPGLVVIFVFFLRFLCNSISSQVLVTAERLEKHAAAHASSMLGTDNNNNNNLSREPKKLKIASIALKRIQRTIEEYREAKTR